MAKATFYLMVAQVVFLGSGYVIHFAVAGMVSPEDYGRFGVVLSILMLAQVFLARGVPEATTKYIAEGRDTEEVFRKGMRIQAKFSLGIFFLIILISPAVAFLLDDSKLVLYIIVCAFLIPIRAILNIYRGVFTGLRQFRKTYVLSFINSGVRVPLVLVLVIIGLSVPGAITGYILASSICLILAVSWRDEKTSGPGVSNHDLIHFSYPVIIFSFSYLLISNLDLFFVKSLLGSEDAGYYTAARTISFTPYVAASALTFTLLPSIAKSYSEKNEELTRSYIEKSFRYTLLLIVPLAALITVMAPGILLLFYPSEYEAASSALGILIIGISFLVFFIISGTILTAIGKQRIPMMIGLLLVPVICILNYVMVQLWDMEGAACATTIACFTGTLMGLFYVKRIFGVLMSSKSFARIIVSVLPASILGYAFPLEGLLIVPWAVFLLFTYAGMLILTREVEKYDLSILKSFAMKK